MAGCLSAGISVASYILLSLGLQTIARRRGIHRPWLAWIPVANLWLLGCISDQYRHEAHGQVKNKRKKMLILGITTYALTAILLILAISMLIDLLPYLPDELLDINQWQKMATMDQTEMESYLITLLDGTDNIPAAMESTVLVKGALVAILGLGVMGTAIALAVLEYMAYHDIFAAADPRTAGMYFMIGLLGSFLNAGFLLPLFVFINREKDFGMPPRSGGQIIDARDAWIEPEQM